MLKVITSPDKFQVTDSDIAVFLAGGICNCPDWQKEVINQIKEIYNANPTASAKNLLIFNPRRENFPIDDPSAADAQISWEFKYLEKMSIFSIFFAASDSDQPICMYELGRNIVRMQMRYPADWEKRLVITTEKKYKRCNDVVIQTKLATNNKVNATVEDFDSKESSSIAYKDHAKRIYDAYIKCSK